ncbi:MAG: T9SS type A sorting domain-containing protein [Bacteroidales bacterium]|nr:T9SS type A sorting domain-containing protein [Bacteroidales bacterium]
MGHKPFIFILLLFFFSGQAFSQVPGCTDPQATNYNPEAVINDGSCLYPNTSIHPETVVNPLPESVNETSGLIYWNGGLWTHNDSGNEAVLYKLDTITGQILQTISITGAVNIDWEDIAQDDMHIYIGDFGNNEGNRTDLRIYKTAKADYPQIGDGSVPVSLIEFSYGDQTSFSRENRSNDYDCEALISFNDSLFIFTKNWVNQQTRLYGMPVQPGVYTLNPVATFNTDGLITGADMIADGSEIVLCGYKNYNPFIWLLYDFQGSNFFGGNKRRINFSGMLGTQTEGASYTYGKNVYISCEKTMINAARLFRLSTAPWTDLLPTDAGGSIPANQDIRLYPNPGQGTFRLQMNTECSDGLFTADLFSCFGQQVLSGQPVVFSECTAGLQLPPLNDGLYFLRISSAESTHTAKLMVGR